MVAINVSSSRTVSCRHFLWGRWARARLAGPGYPMTSSPTALYGVKQGTPGDRAPRPTGRIDHRVRTGERPCLCADHGDLVRDTGDHRLFRHPSLPLEPTHIGPEGAA